MKSIENIYFGVFLPAIGNNYSIEYFPHCINISTETLITTFSRSIPLIAPTRPGNNISAINLRRLSEMELTKNVINN